MYVFPSAYYPKENINNIPKHIAHRLRKIRDSDEKFHMGSDEYQNYLVARDCNISSAKKQFHSVKDEARQVKQKVTDQNFNLVTVYNHILNNLQKVINNNLPLLYSDSNMRAVFPVT